MADVDGRLDLDELGRVIEEASGLDTPAPPAPIDLDLLEGVAGPSLSERMGTWRVSVWMRRHRVLVAAVATVAVAIGAVVLTEQARRPPDDDGLLHLTVLDYPVQDRDRNGFDSSDPTGTVVSGTYSIVPDRGGDTDTLVGVTGPGIRASSAFVQDANVSSDGPRWTVSAILGCDDPAASTASVGEYRLVARRTDGFGRTVQEPVRLPIGTEMAWDQQVRLACLQTQVQTRLSLVSASASLTDDFQSMVVRLRVLSSLDHDISVTASGGPGESVRGQGLARTISPGTPSDLVVPFTFEDCAAPNMQPVPVSPPGSPDPVYVSERGVAFDVTVPGDNQLFAAWSAVWSDQMAATVHRLVETACRGVPPATVRTGTVRIAAQSEVQFVRDLYGDPNGTALLVRFDVATTSPTVKITDVVGPNDVARGNVPAISTSGTAATHHGHALVGVLWRTTCDPGATPPMLQLHLTRGTRHYAVLVTMNDAGLTRGLVASCPGLLPEALVANGWGAVPQPLPQPASGTIR